MMLFMMFLSLFNKLEFFLVIVILDIVMFISFCFFKNLVFDLIIFLLIFNIFDNVFLFIGLFKDICFKIEYFFFISLIVCGINFF